MTQRQILLVTWTAFSLLACAGSVQQGLSPQSVAVEVTPLVASLRPGGSTTFEAVVTGTADTRVTWMVEGNASGSVTANGVYTAPSLPGTYQVVATSVADSSQSAVATVSVSTDPAVVVAVNPRTATLSPGGSRDFSCAVAGNANTACTWVVREAGGGSVSASSSTVGHYVAPAQPGTYHLVATSVADSTKSDVATITVASAQAVAVTINPRSISLQTGAVHDFTCTVSGATNTNCSWVLREAGGGSVNGTAATVGHYVAPAQPGTYHMVATSVADSTKSDVATITVTQGNQPPPSNLKEALTRLATRKIFFAHNSVGMQILEGVGALATANGVTITISSRGDLSGYDGISETWVGTNTDPASKVNDFTNNLMPAYGSKARYSMMKLCFVDFNDTNRKVTDVFDSYKKAVDAITASYPNVILVHMTVPLCNRTDAQSNLARAEARHQFNQLLRGQYQASGRLFDLALHEATDSSAGGVQVEGQVQVLASRWSQSDNCHLSDAGKDYLARAFVQYLASLP